MPATNLDIDVLRTLATAQTLGGFNRAAERIGRSQSAVSQQIHRLEEQLNVSLFRKNGRGLALTEAGDLVLAYARRILDLNDEVVAAVRGLAVEGSVRFGLPGDFAETWLPTALGRFKRAHPAVQIETVVDRNAVLLERFDRGELDLALTLDNSARQDAEVLATLPMVWIGPASGERAWADAEPVPLALFSAPCACRQAAIDALDGAGIPWRVTFTSPSLPGLWAAVAAGLGITVRTEVGLPDTLKVLDAPDLLPKLGRMALSLHGAGLLHRSGESPPPAAARLREILIETLAGNLTSIRHAELRMAM